MAQTESKIVIKAENRTDAAFRAVNGNLRSLSRLANQVRGVFAAGVVGAFVRDTVRGGEELKKLSSIFGVSVEKLSAWQYAAKQTTGSVEPLNGALTYLASNIEEALLDPLSDAANYFRAVGVNMREVAASSNPTQNALEQIAAKFSSVADGQEKVFLARKLMGRGGAELIPFLNELEQLEKQAHDAGAVLDKQWSQFADNFGDTIDRSIAQLKKFVSESEVIKAVLKGIEIGFKGIATAALSVETLFVTIGRGLGALGAAAVALLQRDFEQAKGVWKAYKDDFVQYDIQQTEKLKKIWAEYPEAVGKAGANVGKNLPRLSINFVDRKALEKTLADLEKATRNSQIAITDDERIKAYERMAIARDEWIFKLKQQRLWVEEGKKATAEQKEAHEAFLKWLIAAEKQAAHESAGPVEQMIRNWRNASRQIQEATARWLDDASDRLTDFIMTGKFSFTDFANSIIRDILRIQIQKQIAGIFTPGGGDGIGSALASFFGFAHGGQHPGGFRVVGENGPELEATGPSRVFNAAQTKDILSSGGGGDMSVSVNVINQSSQPVKAENRGVRNDGRKFVLDVVLSDIDNNGPLRTAIAGIG